MKKIRFGPNVPAEIRVIPQPIAMTILEAIHRYAETGAGRVKPLSGEFEGLLRLRVGNHRVFFQETADTITIPHPRSPQRLPLMKTAAAWGQAFKPAVRASARPQQEPPPHTVSKQHRL